MHSAPKYYGIVAAMLFAIPAMAVLGLWLSVDENIILRIVMSEFFPDMRAKSQVDIEWLVSQIQILAQTGILGNMENADALQGAAARFQHLVDLNETLRNAAVVVVGAITAFIFTLLISDKLRARPIAETIIDSCF